MAGLAAYRRAALLSQRELAAKADVAPSTIEDIESGTSGRSFTARTIRKIAAALKLEDPLSVDEFRGVIQNPKARQGGKPRPASGKRKAVSKVTK